jgi:hypothetical protein
MVQLVETTIKSLSGISLTDLTDLISAAATVSPLDFCY